MKANKILILTAVCSLFLGTTACNYLDKMPEDQLTMEMIFSDKTRTEDWLAGVYSGVPNPMWGYFKDQGWNVMGDDLSIPVEWSPFGWENVYNYTSGNWHPDSSWNPNYWQEMPKRIRSALIFIERARANIAQGMSPEYVDRMKQEANFLILYYYSLMLEVYGPVPCSKYEMVSVDTPLSELMTPQMPYDEIVDWLDEEFVKVSQQLPAVYTQGADWGRATSAMCLAMRARMLLFAASPLFNGNPDFQDWKNGAGVNLFGPADQSKWDRAVQAHKELIDHANANGYELYKEYTNGVLDPFMSYYNMSLKKFGDGNKEIIFGRTFHRDNDYYQGLHTWQDHHLPKGIGGNAGLGVTQEMVDAFYTKEGVSPITGYIVTNETRTPVFNLAANYDETSFSVADDVRSDTKWVGVGSTAGKVAETGTFNMYCNREPRFYVSVIFHGAWLDVVKRKAQILQGQQDNPNTGFDTNQTGYNVRKRIPVDAYPREARHPYQPGILYRLAEAYLGYAEALNEAQSRNVTEALTYINFVRERAGIPNYSGGTSYEEIKQLIQTERRIEFNCEGIRFNDIRRWKIGEQMLNGPFMGMNRLGTSDADFHKRVKYRQRVFNSKMYVWPVPIKEIDKNPKLTQAPGY